MSGWPVIFLILAIIAGILGFGVAGAAADVGKLLVAIFLTLLVVATITGNSRGRTS